MKEKLTKAISYFNKFVQSDWFILFAGLLVFIGWVTEAWVPLLCIITAISIIPLFLTKETKHLLVPIFTFTFIISTNRHQLNSYIPLIALLGVLVVGVIFNLVRFRRARQHWELLHPTKIKGFHCTLIALIIPFAFGGVGSPYEHPLAVVAALALVVVFALVYTFMMVTNRDSEQKEKLGEYMLKILFVSGIIVSLQLVIYFARLDGIDNIKQAIIDRDINLGWAGKNNVAPIISMCIPAGFYFSIKKSKLSPIFVLVSLLEFALLFTTSCRGVILFTTLAMPAMLLYTIVKSENKLAFGITVCVAFAVAIVLVAYYGELVTEVVGSFLGKGLDSAGRVEGIYPLAWDAFKHWPFFGAGWDYKLGELSSSNYTPYWYHSTALQIIATMGVVGVVTFIFFYFWRYRTMLAHRKNPAYVALLAGLLLFDLYGMIDTNFFGPSFFAMLLCITFVAEINLPDDRYRAFGGRNPFLDIANGCKWIIEWIKDSIQVASNGRAIRKNVGKHDVNYPIHRKRSRRRNEARSQKTAVAKADEPANADANDTANTEDNTAETADDTVKAEYDTPQAENSAELSTSSENENKDE